MRPVTALVLGGWFLFGMYIGVGGLVATHLNSPEALASVTEGDGPIKVEIDGREVPFASAAEYHHYLEVQDSKKLFPIAFALPSLVSLLISTAAFGALGGVARLLKWIAHDKHPLTLTEAASLPALGFLMGMMLLGLSSLVPATLIQGDEVTLRPTTLIFLALIFGFFSKESLAWLRTRFKSMLSGSEETETPTQGGA